MRVAREFLVVCLLALGATGASLSPAHAVVSEDVCGRARALSAQSNSRWVGLDQKGALTLINTGGSYTKNLLDKFVYVLGRDDKNSGKTVAAIKITFHTEGAYVDQDWVRAQNNFKRDPVSSTYADYQDYHSGKKEIFDLKTNFQLARGAFNPEIPFTTFEPITRRQQLSLPKNSENQERTYKVYLITMDGVRDIGSCVDFKPFIPSDTKDMRVEVIDLLPAIDSGNFYRSSASISITQ